MNLTIQTRLSIAECKKKIQEFATSCDWRHTIRLDLFHPIKYYYTFDEESFELGEINPGKGSKSVIVIYYSGKFVSNKEGTILEGKLASETATIWLFIFVGIYALVLLSLYVFITTFSEDLVRMLVPHTFALVETIILIPIGIKVGKRIKRWYEKKFVTYLEKMLEAKVVS